MALGSVRQRGAVLDLLANLYQFPVVAHDELLYLVEHRQLWGRGLSMVDVHLMAAAAIVDGACFWTRDKRLTAACCDIGVPVVDEP